MKITIVTFVAFRNLLTIVFHAGESDEEMHLALSKISASYDPISIISTDEADYRSLKCLTQFLNTTPCSTTKM